MKKSSFFIALTLLVAAVVCWVVWSRSRAPEYVSVIPADAKLIGRVEPVEALKNTGLSLLDLLQLSTDNKELMSTGVDFSAPIYFFSNPQYNLGIVFAMDDVDEFSACLDELQKEGHCEMLGKQRDLHWAEVQSSFMLAYDADKALLVGPVSASAREDMHALIVKYMTQDADESGAEKPLFKMLQKREGHAVVVTTGDLLTEIDKNALSFLPQNVSPQDMRIAGALSVEEEGASLSLFLESDSEYWKQKIKDGEAITKPIDGKVTQSDPQNPVFWMALNLSGAKFYEALLNEPSISKVGIKLDENPMLAEFIKSVEGHVVASFQVADFSELRNPSFLVTAEFNNASDFCTGGKWAESFQNALQQMGFTAEGENSYSMRKHRQDFYCGWKDDVFYITNRLNLAMHAGQKTSEPGRVESMTKAVKDNRFYSYIDLNLALETAKQMGLVAFLSAEKQEVLDLFDYFSMSSTDVNECTFRLHFKPGSDVWKKLSLCIK